MRNRLAASSLLGRLLTCRSQVRYMVVISEQQNCRQTQDHVLASADSSRASELGIGDVWELSGMREQDPPCSMNACSSILPRQSQSFKVEKRISTRRMRTVTVLDRRLWPSSDCAEKPVPHPSRSDRLRADGHLSRTRASGSVRHPQRATPSPRARAVQCAFNSPAPSTRPDALL